MGKKQKSRNPVILLTGQPKPGTYYTQNRHNCLGQAQIKIVVSKSGEIKTFCPTCGAEPWVIYEDKEFFYSAGTIISPEGIFPNT